MNKKTVKRSPLTKLSLVAKSEGMGIDELDKFCAENGTSFSELQSWRDLALSAMENSGNGEVVSAKFHEQETAKLQAELNRNDNAFAESIFATMKDRIIYPEYFSCIEDAEAFVADFVEWYNYEHLHSALDLLTPFCVHYGLQGEVLERRNGLLEEPRKQHPERYGTIRKVYRIEPEVRLKHQTTLKKVI